MPLPEDTTLESRCRIDGLLTFGRMSAVYHALGARCIGVPWRLSEGMPAPTHADRIIAQGRALVRAIEALDVIEPLTLLERIAAQLLRAWYGRRLQYLVAAVPRWAGERILTASEVIRATGSGMPAARVIGGRW